MNAMAENDKILNESYIRITRPYMHACACMRTYIHRSRLTHVRNLWPWQLVVANKEKLLRDELFKQVAVSSER